MTQLTPHDIPDLESVISTAELGRRPSRAPDYAAENRALVALAQEMVDSLKISTRCGCKAKARQMRLMAL